MSIEPRPNLLMTIMALFGAAGVLAGAFGAHGLRETLEASRHVQVWQTAVFYNLIHAVAGVVLASPRSASVRGPLWLWVAGIVLFSGSLHSLALGGPKWLGPVTPVGGVLLVAGWIWLAVSALSGRHR